MMLLEAAPFVAGHARGPNADFFGRVQKELQRVKKQKRRLLKQRLVEVERALAEERGLRKVTESELKDLKGVASSLESKTGKLPPAGAATMVALSS